MIQGIEAEKAKAISKKIRDEGPKGVQAQIQGDQLRVTGKKRDDLQAVIALLKEARLRRRPPVHQLPVIVVIPVSGKVCSPGFPGDFSPAPAHG